MTKNKKVLSFRDTQEKRSKLILLGVALALAYGLTQLNLPKRNLSSVPNDPMVFDDIDFSTSIRDIKTPKSHVPPLDRGIEGLAHQEKNFKRHPRLQRPVERASGFTPNVKLRQGKR